MGLSWGTFWGVISRAIVGTSASVGKLAVSRA